METGDRYRTPIQDFYADTTIFITGGTGFLGKMLIEKLLRSCPDISMIYVMIRSQKDKSPENRLDEMLESPLYDRIKKEVPNFRKKIVPITGDSNIKGLGLSKTDRNMLIRNVSIIFHMAANMQFYGKIKISTIVNIDATATILKLAKRMPNLKSFIHVSTIYSNCHVKHIEECIYSYPINHKHLITFARNLPENIFEEKISNYTDNVLVYNFVPPVDGPTWNE
ncbi:Putative fatty acyl-CoA reductase [Acromyrmex echinatior]|uniref:Fatty acyl-CoA reductase n=1 Tax=Acromyrmex echinatior TaxID=103372 RepID=F4WHJ6_ACREC|nr:Putative fatty acyl-CoA reductase [Acromyrmex echinatior]